MNITQRYAENKLIYFIERQKAHRIDNRGWNNADVGIRHKRSETKALKSSMTKYYIWYARTREETKIAMRKDTL